jgi:D-tyrosyl-tRNA(Tyr) deacylase
MIALLQRVTQASVEVEGDTIAAIELGVLALIGIVQGDGQAAADRLLQRVLDFRLFAEQNGRMGRSLREVDGALLLVPQFTLAAATDRGNRPSFSPAAAPAQAALLFDYVVAQAQAAHPRVAAGRFGAHMKLALINDGPVTFWLQSAES